MSAELHEEESRAAVLAERLQLTVGGNGVVGRAVSVVDESGYVLGEGVVGYGS